MTDAKAAAVSVAPGGGPGADRRRSKRSRGSRGPLFFRPAACFLALVFAAGLVTAAAPLRAEEATIAVASNFVSTARALQQEFERTSGHRLRLVSGSSGSIHAQIVYGAPFDLFLSADRERAERLVRRGLAEADSLADYALGRLVLWAPGQRLDEEGAKRLFEDASPARRIAIANPDLAPYGRAAREVLRSVSGGNAAEGRLVFGENVAQTFAMVATGNVEAGFIARSQYEAALSADRTEEEAWIVPAEHHAPIRQSMVLLTRASRNVAARAFHTFVSSPSGARLIQSQGYGVASRE